MNAQAEVQPTLAHNNTVIAVQNLLRLLNAPVTRREVSGALQSRPGFPILSISDISETLEEWNIETYTCKVKPEMLAQLTFPALAHLTTDDGYFVVITGFADDRVTYFDPCTGQQDESLCAFNEKWQGVLMLASVEDASPDVDGEKRRYEEEAEVKNYVQSIKTLDGFLTDEECLYIIAYADSKAKFDRSRVQDGDKIKRVISPNRTSYSAYLQEREDAVFDGIFDKVSRYLNTPKENIENLQCVRYGPGEEFKPHYDSNSDNGRLYTVLVYLNDGFAGGETYFPFINLKITPKKGTALIFKDLEENLELISYSLHAGLPVAEGLKYACNIWVRNKPFARMASTI